MNDVVEAWAEVLRTLETAMAQQSANLPLAQAKALEASYVDAVNAHAEAVVAAQKGKPPHGKG